MVWNAQIWGLVVSVCKLNLRMPRWPIWKLTYKHMR
jgi:hypothetical protein